jgi:regulator of RNase E activity RraA
LPSTEKATVPVGPGNGGTVHPTIAVIDVLSTVAVVVVAGGVSADAACWPPTMSTAAHEMATMVRASLVMDESLPEQAGR